MRTKGPTEKIWLSAVRKPLINLFRLLETILDSDNTDPFSCKCYYYDVAMANKYVKTVEGTACTKTQILQVIRAGSALTVAFSIENIPYKPRINVFKAANAIYICVR